MDSLVKLSLRGVGIEVLPSSIGTYCNNLISLSLGYCDSLKRIEGTFHGSKHLRKLKFPSNIERMPQNLFDDKFCLEKLKLCKIRRFPLLLTKLNLSYCGFKDGEIPSNIGELSNLEELDLSRNHFTRLDFSLTQFTQLKLLKVSRCERLVQLPVLPSSISVLLADDCESLKAIGDIYTNCKWLCQVSLLYGRNVIGADKFLQSMLQGNAIENHFIILQVEGLEIPQRFIPPLRKRTRYTLELPENRCNDFCGFLMCSAVSKHYSYEFDKEITMTHTKGMDSEPVFSSDNSVDIETSTWVVYISFGLLRHIAWWDETSNAVSFSNGPNWALGVRLVPRKTRSVPMETTDSSQFYPPEYDFVDKTGTKHA